MLLVLPAILLAATSSASPTALANRAPPRPHQRSDQPLPDDPITATVDLGYSTYQGTTLLPAGINQWLGIRYAAPPLGTRRWRAAEDPEPTTEIQTAFDFQPVCIGVGDQYNTSLSHTVNEDCLFLNIFAPANATSASKLPVLFFIHGGGYSVTSDRNFNGSDLIARSGYGMIFVQMNYRVGAFGFLASETVRAEGELNVGLLDQRKALRWVREYIHLFGGDPEHVVIYGTSAGAGSVAYQLTADGGRDEGLFVGAIAGSPFWPTQRTVGEMEVQFGQFVGDVGCGGEDVMGCLRGKSTEELQLGNVNRPFPEAEDGAVPNWYFLPVVDGEVWTETQSKLFAEGKVVKVPLIVGDDTDEGTYFSPNANSSEELQVFIRANYPQLLNHQLEDIANAYSGVDFPSTGGRASYYNASASAYGEATFTCPGMEVTRSLATFNSPAKSWNYRYNVRTVETEASGIGVPHVVESSAIWGPGNAGECEREECLSYLPGGYNAAMVPIVMDYWISFVLTLDPNTLKNDEAPVWDPWQQEEGVASYSYGVPIEQRLKFEANATAMENVPSAQLQRCGLWRSLAASLEQK